MDAVSRLCRFLLLAGLIALVGCKGTSASVGARGQSPSDLPPPLPPAQIAPVAPPQPLPQVGPSTPISTSATGNEASALPPVQGYPVVTAIPPSPSAAPVSPAGMPMTPPPVPVMGPISPVSLSVPLADPEMRRNPPVAMKPSASTLTNSTPQVKTVAIVGKSASLITDQEVVELVRQRLADYRHLTGAERAAREKELYYLELGNVIARELIIDDLIDKLKKNKKSVDEFKEMAAQAAEQSLRQIRKNQGARTQEEFIMMLKAQGLTLAGLKRSIERQMMAEEYVHSLLKETGRTAGFAEIRAYYDQHLDEFQLKDHVRWQDLFISFNKFPSAEAARAHAEQVRQAALNGTDFVSLIKAEENSPRGRQNWDGIGTTREDVPHDVSAHVWSLAPGQISAVIPAPAGFHIVKVMERQYAGLKPFDTNVQIECSEKLKRSFREKDRQKIIEDLWRDGMVRVFDID